MKTVFIGGGRGCLEVLEMVTQGRLALLSPEIVGVVDPDPTAPGRVYAQQKGWPTFDRLEDALSQTGVELVIEVTGIDEVCEEISRLVPDRVRIMDHQMARVFWDLDKMGQDLRTELERKTQLEAEIREDRRRLQELLDSLPDAVMVLDDKGRIDRVNRRFEEVTGTRWVDAKGQNCHELFCHGELITEVNGECCPYQQVIESGKPLTVEQQNSCIRGACPSDECYYQITANPIRNASGEINVVITSREITEQVRLGRETEELAERARQNKLAPADVQGGTITITNHGISGSLFAAPIINQPQCAILGVGAIQKRVKVLTDQNGNDSIAIRPMVYLSLTFDHRILDGAGADHFLAREVEILDNW